jgi:translation initiation factor IF-2
MRSKELFDEGSKTIKVTEFVTVGEIDYDGCQFTKVIGTCMSLGIMVTMNHVDAETLTIVADEFGYEVEFITVDIRRSNCSCRRQRRRFSSERLL